MSSCLFILTSHSHSTTYRAAATCIYVYLYEYEGKMIYRTLYKTFYKTVLHFFHSPLARLKLFERDEKSEKKLLKRFEMQMYSHTY